MIGDKLRYDRGITKPALHLRVQKEKSTFSIFLLLLFAEQLQTSPQDRRTGSKTDTRPAPS